jgi:prepilin-type processing-associated H-X9-DG protein
MYEAFPPAVRYDNDNSFVVIAWDWVQTMQEEVVSPGPLWSFTDQPQTVQQCPEYEGPSNFGADPFTGYNYNASHIGGHGPFPFTNWQHFQPGVAPHRCNRGSTCAMFGDGGWKGGANKFMRSPLDPHGLGVWTTYAGGQAFRHGHETNVAYVDCHVDSASKAHRGEHANDELLTQVMDYPRNGFLSDGDEAYDPR